MKEAELRVDDLIRQIESADLSNRELLELSQYVITLLKASRTEDEESTLIDTAVIFDGYPDT